MGGADQVAVNHVLDLFKIDDLGEPYFTSRLSDFKVRVLVHGLPDCSRAALHEQANFTREPAGSEHACRDQEARVL